MGSKVVLNRIEVLKPLDVYEVEYKKKPVYVFENELLTRLYTNVGGVRLESAAYLHVQLRKHPVD